MRPIDLDFHRAPRHSRLGWILLAAGLAMAAVLAAVQHEAATETAHHQKTLHDLETRLAEAAPPQASRTSDDATLATARQVLAQAERPWNQLFATLEAADDKNTAILSITPDTVRGQVRIHVEARHLSAMLAYQQRLQADNGLRHVTLVDHELVQGAAETPVRFHVSASWADNRGGNHRAAP